MSVAVLLGTTGKQVTKVNGTSDQLIERENGSVTGKAQS